MTSLEFLQQIYKLDNRIKKMNLELEEYNRLASALTSPTYGVEKVDISRDFKAPFVKWIEKAMEQEKKIKKEIEKLNKVKNDVMLEIEKVDNIDYRLILKFRYVESLPFPVICEKLYISKSTMRRWHNSAVNRIKVPKEYKNN